MMEMEAAETLSFGTNKKMDKAQNNRHIYGNIMRYSGTIVNDRTLERQVCVW